MDLKKRTRKIVLIDGTLREGEQSAGVFFNYNEKLALLKLMDAAGIDVADCGMPAVSNEEFAAIKKLSSCKGFNIRIGASIRCREDEIELFKKTGASDCFMIVPVSDIHISAKFGMNRGEYLKYIETCVKTAGILNVPFLHVVLEDITRADMSFVKKIIKTLLLYNIEAFYVCDTLGVASPEKIGGLIAQIDKLLINTGINIGVHCHNDLGLALANTLAAFDAGAGYITFTQNGIGERCGNVKCHELVTALIRLKNYKKDIDFGVISKLSELTEEISGIFMPATEPIVGFNAFRHESGIHVSGLLKNRKVYEEYKPEDIGKINQFVLGKHSGIALIDKLLKENYPDFQFSGEQKKEILKMVKKTRVNTNKSANKKMKNLIKKFTQSALGGISMQEFKKIADKIKMLT